MLVLTTTCRCCGREIAFPAEAALWSCAACGMLNARPQAEGPTLDVLRRAVQQRLHCDFHNAVTSYQHVLLYSHDEHEALWGLALCRYGVEYVDDPRTGKRMPTVHSVRRKPLQLDADYLAAIDCAPPEVCAQYEAEAEYIDDAMSRIIELSEKCPPYDVFLCHKTTKPGSEDKTQDYDHAFRLYHGLEKQGYRVFFAPVEMKDVAAGSDYEAAIFHALDTAKVMLLVCSDTEYLTSAWVRSEWTRFLEMSDERKDKCLVPMMYGGFGARELPRELRVRKIQGLTMEDWDAQSTIMNVLERMCGKREAQPKPVPAPAPAPRPEPVPAPAPEQKPAPAPTPAPAPKPSVKKLPYTPEKFFEVEPCEDGCKIVKYAGKTGLDQNLYIPPTIQGMPVRNIMEAFYHIDVDGKIIYHEYNVVYIPETVPAEANFRVAKCREFRTAEEGAFTVRDGVLFCGDVLVRYPVLRNANQYSVPAETRKLRGGAFMDAGQLEKVQLPEGLEEIEEFSFIDCSQLKTLNLPRSLTVLDKDVFQKCDQLKLRIYLASNAQRLFEEKYLGIYEELDNDGKVIAQKGVYTPEEFFEVEPHEDGCKITGFCCGDDRIEELYIPPTIQGMEVLDIKAEAFKEAHLCFLDVVYLPETIQNLNGQSLDGLGCRWFKTSDDPDSLLSTRDGVLFYDDDMLVKYPSLKRDEHYTVPDGTRIIFCGAFELLGGLKEIILPEGLEEIWSNAFDCCFHLEPITLPRSLTELRANAFFGCSSLVLRVYRDSYAHTAVREQSLPHEVLEASGRRAASNIRYTPERDFKVEPYEDGCKITAYTGRANDLYIPPTIGGKKVRTIGGHAFLPDADPSNLYPPRRSIGMVYLPATLQSIAGTAFQGIAVGEFRVEESNPWMDARDGVLFYKAPRMLLAYPHDSAAQRYTVPAGTSDIFNLAFAYSENLREVVLPDSLNEICVGAFWGCKNLRKLQLPEGLEKLGSFAFGGCNALDVLTIPRSVTDLAEDAFDDNPSLTLRVCKGSQAHVLVKGENVEMVYELLSQTGQPLEPCTLVFFRKAKLFGSGRKDTIRIDGGPAQTLASGGRVTFKVAPGTHIIEITDEQSGGQPKWSAGQKVMTRELQPGETCQFDRTYEATLSGFLSGIFS